MNITNIPENISWMILIIGLIIGIIFIIIEYLIPKKEDDKQ